MAERQARWKVAIVDDHERSRAALRAAVWAAGGTIAAEVMRRADALAAVGRAAPDVVVMAVGLPDGDGIATAAEVAAGAACPVVLYTSHTGDDLVARANAAGVMGFLLKPLRAAEVAPALDLAIARFRESRDLRRALEERKLVERAKGLLMTRLGLTEEAAFARIRRAAMDSRRPMGDVAQAVLVSELVTQPASAPRTPAHPIDADNGVRGERGSDAATTGSSVPTPRSRSPRKETACPHSPDATS